MPLAPAPKKPAAGSGGYVNFGQLYALNQPGAAAMADKVGQGVAQQGAAAQTAITGARTQYQQATQKAAGAGATGGAFEAPKTWAEAGVNTLALAGQASGAGAAARGLASEAGRAAAVKSAYAGGLYGNAGFDTMLMGAAGGQQFDALAQQYGGLEDGLAAAQGTAAEDYAAAEAAHGRGAAEYATAQERAAEAERQRLLAEKAKRDEALAKRREGVERRTDPYGRGGNDRGASYGGADYKAARGRSIR